MGLAKYDVLCVFGVCFCEVYGVCWVCGGLFNVNYSHNIYWVHVCSGSNDSLDYLIGTIDIGVTNFHAVTFINTMFTAVGTLPCQITQPGCRFQQYRVKTGVFSRCRRLTVYSDLKNCLFLL